MLAVAASFAKVVSVNLPSDSDQSDRQHYSVDGWGRIRVSGDLGIDSNSLGSGPRYGVVLCLAAAVIVLGWLIQRRLPNLPRLAPHGLAISGLGAVFLCGVVACLLVVSWPVLRGQYSAIPLVSCLYLAVGSALLGLATWFGQWRNQQPDRQPAAEDA